MKNFTFRKRLLALALCAFAWIGANAYEIDGNTLIIYGTGVEGKTADAVSNMSQPTESTFANVTTIKLVGKFTGWSGGWLKNANSNNSKNNISTINLEEADFSSITATLTIDETTGKITDATASPTQAWGFSEFPNLKNVTWPAAGKITVIPHEAFKLTGLESVTIPGYIQFIEDNAFCSASNDNYLKKVTFEEYPEDATIETSQVQMYIGFQAFSNTYGLMDVYINTLGDIYAKNNAFPHSKTYGHANTGAALATLHFPEEKADEYANLEHVLDEATAKSDKDFQEWLVAHYEDAGNKQNGFYEFVSNGINNEEDGPSWGDKFLRTYSFAPTISVSEDVINSDAVKAILREHPDWQVMIAQVVPPGVKAFIVDKLTKNDAARTVTLHLKKVNVIPGNTGVILFGGTNSSSADGTKKFLSMMLTAYVGKPYTRENSDNKNYLSATCSTNPDKYIHVEPYGQDEYGFYHRDFLMGSFSATKAGRAYYKENDNTYGDGPGIENTPGDWKGFFRAISGEAQRDKAYLRLTLDEYPYPEGGEIIIDASDQTDSSKDTYYRNEYKDQNLQKYTTAEMKQRGFWYIDENTPIEWADSWGTRNLAAGAKGVLFDAELNDVDWVNNVLSGISTVKTEKNQNSGLYTLQGVKVNKPQKGIYIQNGKKMIIK